MSRNEFVPQLSEPNLIIKFLDLIRSTLLKYTMQFDFLRTIFTTRAYRLFSFFLLSVVFNLYLALKLPLWSLLLGPLILGIPHLLSTIRYVPKLTGLSSSFSTRNIYYALGSIFVFIALVRLFFLNVSFAVMDEWPNSVELVTAFLIFLFISIKSKAHFWRIVGASVMLMSLLVGSLKYPFETLGFLVLAHNFVGFFYWLGRASVRLDRYVAFAALLIFSIINIFIFSGIFDSFIMGRTSEILNGIFNEAAIGAQVIQDADYGVLARIASAYAFGQGLHYFVWLKAIPEQELSFEHSVSFSSSMKLLKSDLSSKLLYMSGIIVLVLLGVMIFKNIPEARLVYMAIAAFHGYFEIAALAFIKVKSV